MDKNEQNYKIKNMCHTFWMHQRHSQNWNILTKTSWTIL